MKLFEVDLGSVRTVLAVLQRQSSKPGSSGEIPYAVVMRIADQLDLPLGGLDSDRQQMMIALKNAVDPGGEVIKDIKPDGTLVLNKPNDPAEVGNGNAGGGSTVDKMAKSNSSLTPKI